MERGFHPSKQYFSKYFLFEQYSHVCLVICIFDYRENNPSIAYAITIGEGDCFQIGMTDGGTIRLIKKPMAGVESTIIKGYLKTACR